MNRLISEKLNTNRIILGSGNFQGMKQFGFRVSSIVCYLLQDIKVLNLRVIISMITAIKSR